MSRTKLCVLTASILVIASFAVMALRYSVLGGDVALPSNLETWKVTLVVQGKTTGDAKLSTLAPSDTPRQHVLKESTTSELFTAKPNDAKPVREMNWTTPTGSLPMGFRISYECYCSMRANDAVEAMRPPNPGDFVRSDAAIDSDHPELANHARQLTQELDNPVDKATAIYEYVTNEIDNEPTIPGANPTAIDCYQTSRGDALAKARLLVALCRNRGIPSRIVIGLPLSRGSFSHTHAWAEAYLRDHWVPMCPTNRHYGRVPRHWLAFAHDDVKLIHGKNVRNLDSAFLIERTMADGVADASFLRKFFTAFSPFALPPTERHLVEFLLLLPIAALIVCISRNVIGLTTFGTFTPALLGLAFRELHGMVGVFVFVAMLLTGWVLRKVLNRFHLLQVPRLAVMLSLVVCLLITFVVGAHAFGWQTTHYVSLFPLVILTGMIERFWTLEEEDGATASFRTLFCTLLVAVVISLVISRTVVLNQMVRFPETLGVVIALQLLLGRYTGYRLLELYRFRDFIAQGSMASVAMPKIRLY